MTTKLYQVGEAAVTVQSQQPSGVSDLQTNFQKRCSGGIGRGPCLLILPPSIRRAFHVHSIAPIHRKANRC